jgi:Raf kinase inhibitor-like YbhB/YbcL family protein
MILQRLCFVAALATTISMLTACGGSSDGGFPVTPGVPDSSDNGTDGPDMPEAPESVSPEDSSEPQPSSTPIVIAPNNPIGAAPDTTQPSSTPNVPAPTASPASSNTHFVPATSSAAVASGVHPTASFTVRSTTFKNEKTMPLSMVYRGSGCNGRDMSPQLQWTGAPKKTKSFAVLMLDTTAIFWHWGVYDIVKTATSLPQNAGTSSSKYGKEVLNDWSIHFGKKNRGYGGPCPPKGSKHRYVFTVYALDTMLNLPASAHAEDLDLAIRSHILGSASIVGLYKI